MRYVARLRPTAAARVGLWLAGVALLFGLAGPPAARGQAVPTTQVPFTLTISGSADDPTFEFANRSRLKVRRLRITIGHGERTYDSVSGITTSSGASVTSQSPGTGGGGSHSQTIDLSLANFGPGATLRFKADLDILLLGVPIASSVNYRTVLFNNGAEPNAVVTVDTEEGQSQTLTLPDDPDNPNAPSYTFARGARKLLISSVAESGDIVGRVDVRTFPTPTAQIGQSTLLATNVGSPRQFDAFDGETVEIRAVREVYFNIHGEDITGAVAGNPAAIQSDAEERFTAFGISVNNQPQTGDPTLYRFEVTGDTVIEAKWKHDYALTVSHDFSRTESLDRVGGVPWAGPVSSAATGNPDPPAQKHWIQRGTTFIARVDGQVVDQSRPGLAVRYVPKAFLSYGPPNRDTSSAAGDRNKRLAVGGQRVDIRSDTATFTSKPFIVGQSPPQRQQVPEFTMHGPGGIRYVWQIQFGVQVNVDDQAKAAVPKVFTGSMSALTEAGTGEGTFYFDPGTAVVVASLATAPGTNNNYLKGWISGDGHYFGAVGDVDTVDGTLLSGAVPGSPAGWQKTFTGPDGQTYRGLQVPNLQRAARVFWQHSSRQIRVSARIGEYVFQTDRTNLAGAFPAPPELFLTNQVAGVNKNVNPPGMAVWDEAAARLYPLVPGSFTVKWQFNGTPAEVIVTAAYPATPHYPHIAGAPPVALDPDPADNLIFKEVKYTENSAIVDGNKWFTATNSGRTVLLFGDIQRTGRGVPREFLKVRVVETRLWNDNPAPSATAVIGQKVTDALDKAGLGTGYLVFTNGVRYNPFVYDVTRLSGLAAKDVYDAAGLQANPPSLAVANRNLLPGPVIPVNLHPGAKADNTDRIVVVWYEDPLKHDRLLWPHRARAYTPRWPATEAEGLGRIVIASQFGSESVNAFGADQLVAPAIGNFPRETTYNPSRLQSVQVYQQGDRTKPGYNPNEEHALMAPSLRFAAVSPRPPAAYALRHNDLNFYNAASPTESGQAPATYTSHPYVLVQFFDTADQEFKMRVYSVQREDAARGYRFANRDRVTLVGAGVRVSPNTTTNVLATVAQLNAEPHVKMEAGEPVIPFYPIGVVNGAAPCPDTFGVNLKQQAVFWKDHKGTSWAVSGGTNAWFIQSDYYRMAADFWWPEGEAGVLRAATDGRFTPSFPNVGDCISFLPQRVQTLRSFATGTAVAPTVSQLNEMAPTPVLYKSDWPEVLPVLKAGETLTFSGGEYRFDRPFTTVVDNGVARTVETPGLPGVVAFACAEVVFDSLNPLAESSRWTSGSGWTARMAQVLEVRSVPLAFPDFPPELAPATKRTRVKSGKYVFAELPASLQNRVRYDPLLGKLEISGLLNNKAIGDSTLTASPPQVYILEPNIFTADELAALRKLSEKTAWIAAVDNLGRLSRNPGLLDTDNQAIAGLAGLSKFGSDNVAKLKTFWHNYYQSLGLLSATAAVPLPIAIGDADDAYHVGLAPKVLYDDNGNIVTIEDPLNPGLMRTISDPRVPAPARLFGPGLALLPNGNFLDLKGGLPPVSYVVVAENNDPTLGGSPVTLHVIKVDRNERYRGAIKTTESDNVFDENLGLRHQGDFAANPDDLFFEWWYRPDDGSLNVPPPDLIAPGQTNPWKLFPDDTGKQGRGRYQITLKGNPNAPETLIADTWWFVRYRHKNDEVSGVNWKVPQTDASGTVVSNAVNFTWAGAGNSQPFVDADQDGIPDYRAQLAMGWIKRVLDAVNPYEARIRSFEGDAPSTKTSMIAQFGARFEGPVALNPDKNVIENVGLIELYQTILKRGRDLTIDLSRPVSTPAVANALQLASTRLSDFYTLLGNEAYVDAQDPAIGHGSGLGNDLSGAGPGYGGISPAVFSFQNQMSSLIEEELALLRGVDDFFARPVYNRLFWNFTKGEGEAAYALNYNLSDITGDGFINENDAMTLYPQGHGDAWGHYLTALRNTYTLLNHPFFNWVSRSEFYNLQDIVFKVDFLDERKFAQTAAAKAKAGAEIVNLTYREKYVERPEAQWQGYTDSNKDRAWGVQDWARRAGQGAYFDWVTANALLPSVHPNETLTGIQKVDRQANADITVVSANLNAIQTTVDQANKGHNPLGLGGNVVPMDLDPNFLIVGSGIQSRFHFDQIYERALAALENAKATWDNANEDRNRLRQVANTEAEFRNEVFQEDLAYKNALIQIFGRPYEGTIGAGKIYPAGYDGPDLLLYMYVDVRTIDNNTVPGPTASFAAFAADGTLNGGDIFNAFNGAGGARIGSISPAVRALFAPTFAGATSNFVLNFGFGQQFVIPVELPNTAPFQARSGWYGVNYTDVSNPKVALDGLANVFPVSAAGYTYQAPRDWGRRLAVGELQTMINAMLQQEASVASSIAAWDALTGVIVRTFRLVNAKIDTRRTIDQRNKDFAIAKVVIESVIKSLETARAIHEGVKDTVDDIRLAVSEAVPKNLPTGGLAVSPGDAAAPARTGIQIAGAVTKGGISGLEVASQIIQAVTEIAMASTEVGVNVANADAERALAEKELLVELENTVGDEPVLRVNVFKEIEALRGLSDEYRSKVAEGVRLIDERTAYNKRVAAATQFNRYQDMTFRVSRNHAMKNYRDTFELAAKYAYLAAKAYDYETNFDPADPGHPGALMADIIRVRHIGQYDGAPRVGQGGLAEALAKLKANWDNLKPQLGINNAKLETGKMSLRTEHFRILPKDAGAHPADPLLSGSGDANTLWKQVLARSRVADLWQVPEFRHHCRAFASHTDASGNPVAEPGLVIRFGSTITAGKNFFGKPLAGGDHAYDPSQYSTRIAAIGLWFSDYQSGDLLSTLPSAPRAYLVPVGTDVMSVSTSPDPNVVRFWKVLDQQIPVPYRAVNSSLDQAGWIPLLDSLNGRLGEPRKFPMMRAYHDGGDAINGDELAFDTRLVGRTVWNSQWVLIIPGRLLNADPNVGLDRFIEQVSDIKLVFQTYGFSGN
jgi:hypothetical protein